MHVVLNAYPQLEPQYHGLRMTAEEYCALQEDGFRYELIDGVVHMSPSPTPQHQKIGFKVAAQIDQFLQKHPLGDFFQDLDVNLKSVLRRDVVYQPDVVYFSKERLAEMEGPVLGVPDLVVEIVSPTSRQYDHRTKKSDYEGSGVGEYWIIDPIAKQMTFYRLHDGRYVEVQPDGQRFTSQAIPGFSLDLTIIQRYF